MTWSVLDQYPPDNIYLGHCSKCQVSDVNRPNSPPDKVVLFPVEIPVDINGELVLHDGQIALCSSCLGEGASAIGWIPPDKAESLRRKNREYGAENKRLTERTAVLDQVREVLV